MTSIPSWNYDASYYDLLTHGAKFTIRTDPLKGKGLFATEKISDGDTVHEETALCCSQNLDDVLSTIPVCGNCLVSLESPRRCVARVTQSKTLASQVPFSKLNIHRRSVKCVYAEAGCSTVFCSVRCREAAWSRFHYAGCRGRMTEEQRRAFDAFLASDWESGGVNYSDTVFLALRFLCMVMTNVRLHRQSLEVAYRPIAQLIRAPLGLFRFAYLLPRGGDNQTDTNAAEERDEAAREAFLALGVRLVDRILSFSEAERHFLTVTEWSELLGAILLNGQERSPPSNYDRMREIVKGMPSGAAIVKAFEEKVQSAGVDPQQLYLSSRGQGIYTIGCLFNHSCEPNVQVLYSSTNDETLTVDALRDIEPGEELCISYIDESLPYPDRQQQLYEHYLFTCECTKCKREKSES